MSEADRQKWDVRYRAWGEAYAQRGPLGSLAALAPRLRSHLIARQRDNGTLPATPPEQGQPIRQPLCALDLACGAGRNALFLAALGYSVKALDISAEALGLLAAEAKRRGLAVATERVDLDEYRPKSASFELIVDTYFLDRRLWPLMAAALRPGGLLFIETFTVDRAVPCARDVDRAFLLEPDELAYAFPALETLILREDREVGVASLLARAPECRQPACRAERPT